MCLWHHFRGHRARRCHVATASQLNQIAQAVQLAADDQVIAVPSEGRFDLDHALIVTPIEAEEQRALEEAIQVSSAASQPTDCDPKKWPVLKALGLKSARAFYANASHVAVFLYEGKIEIWPHDPTKKGQAFEVVREVIPVANMKTLLSAGRAKVASDPPKWVLKQVSGTPPRTPPGAPPPDTSSTDRWCWP